jgi:PAS domain S-box-containing protein
LGKSTTKLPVLSSPGEPSSSGPFTADLQTVLDAFPYYVMLVDADHTVLMANRAVEQSLGIPAAKLLGGYCPSVVHGLDRPYPGCPLETACARGTSVECELAGEEGRILVSGIYETPLKTAQGRPVYLHATRDITEQKVAEAALAQRERTQTALNQLLREALERSAGNQSKAARLLGISRDTLRYRLKKYELG